MLAFIIVFKGDWHPIKRQTSEHFIGNHYLLSRVEPRDSN